MKSKLLIGTSKGLIIAQMRDSVCRLSEVYFPGMPVSMIYVDARSNTWWVALSHRHWGDKLHYSVDEGSTWHDVTTPSYNNYNYKPGKPAVLKKIWVMQQGGHNKPGCLWLGTEPGGLFYSFDNGKTFHLNEGLWNHPSRSEDTQWFGAGKDYPFIHSIVVDPRDSNHVYVAISCAGIFETTDCGQSWHARNNGLIAAYLPNPNTDIGHDPHRLLLCQKEPHVMWQQNHCGIFRSSNGGIHWDNVGDVNGYPKYGFSLAISDVNPEEAWVVPAISDEQRVPLDYKFQVFRTLNSGKTWESKSKGLPSSLVFDLVLRHSFIKNDDYLAIGTNNGNLYFSNYNGEEWQTVTSNLSSINCLCMANVLK